MAEPIKLSQRALHAIARVVDGNPTGFDGKQPAVAPYRKLWQIMAFLREYGCEDQYSMGSGSPSRGPYTEGKMAEFAAVGKIQQILEDALDPLLFEGSEFSPDTAAAYVTKMMARDGYELRKVAGRWRLHHLGEVIVASPAGAAAAVDATSKAFIDEQIGKCRAKLDAKDYDGAITNARTLLEALLYGLEERLTGVRGEHADLYDLFKRVQKPLSLDPGNPKLNNTLRQICTGFTSIVQGLASLRNGMSDAHGGRVRPERHHAVLAVNAAMTFADFLCSTYLYQVEKGQVKPAAKQSGP